jgi:TetR/AcrR family transcriptional regulator, cholesterol catabolism regulator
VSSSTSPSRERLLDRVEDILFENRPHMLSMREIAQHLGMKAASLYYHAEGKEDLFRQVILRSIERNRDQLAEVIAEATPEIEEKLTAIGLWLLQPSPMNLIHTIREDVSKMNPDLASELSKETHNALIKPIEEVFREFIANDSIRAVDPALLAGSYLAILDGIWYVTNEHLPKELGPQMVRDMVGVLLRGLLPDRC